MARRVLLIEQSNVMRKIIAGMIMGHHNDIAVVEADGVKKGLGSLSAKNIHLIIYNWDTVSTDYQFFYDASQKQNIPLLIIGPIDNFTNKMQQLTDKGIAGENLVVFQEDAIGAAITRLCNPLKMRRAKRYNIPGTILRLIQGKIAFFGSAINISTGGILCDIEHSEDFQWATNSAIEIEFDGGNIPINGITGCIKRLSVLEENPDHSPVLLRLAIAFTSISDKALAQLAEVLSKVEGGN